LSEIEGFYNPLTPKKSHLRQTGSENAVKRICHVLDRQIEPNLRYIKHPTLAEGMQGSVAFLKEFACGYTELHRVDKRVLKQALTRLEQYDSMPQATLNPLNPSEKYVLERICRVARETLSPELDKILDIEDHRWHATKAYKTAYTLPLKKTARCGTELFEKVACSTSVYPNSLVMEKKPVKAEIVCLHDFLKKVDQFDDNIRSAGGVSSFEGGAVTKLGKTQRYKKASASALPKAEVAPSVKVVSHFNPRTGEYEQFKFNEEEGGWELQSAT
jgi:hypothetical protein